MPQYFLILFGCALSYLYYHWQLFSFFDDCLDQKRKLSWVIGSFLCNYMIFIICSVTQLHLILNWSLFFLALLLEIVCIYRRNAMIHAFFAFIGTLTGLALNILFRCLFALVLNKPLSVFDNRTLLSENMKRYPILLGFLLTGLILHWCRKRKLHKKLQILLTDQGSIRFLVLALSVLYGYLALNLLTYYTEGSDLPMKLWGIKSVVFVEAGLILTTVYCVRISQLNQYATQNKREREALLREKQEEETIRTLTYTDTLTGCYNRKYAEQILEQIWASKSHFCLCYADLDGLKRINDQYGHGEGDLYLKTAADIFRRFVRGNDYLFRFGGDEFLLLSIGLTPERATRRMDQINRALSDFYAVHNPQMEVSISFGVAGREEADGMETLLHLADSRMYAHKQSAQSCRPS